MIKDASSFQRYFEPNIPNNIPKQLTFVKHLISTQYGANVKLPAGGTYLVFRVGSSNKVPNGVLIGNYSGGATISSDSEEEPIFGMLIARIA